MPTIVELLDERDRIYSQNTGVIFSHMKNVTEGIVEYVGQEPDTFLWDGIDIANGLFIITARTEVMEDVTTVQHRTTGEIMEVPAVNENGDRLQRALTIGLPIELVETGTSEEIIKFLIKMDTEAQTEFELNKQESITTDNMDAHLEEVPETDPRIDNNILYSKRTKH